MNTLEGVSLVMYEIVSTLGTCYRPSKSFPWLVSLLCWFSFETTTWGNEEPHRLLEQLIAAIPRTADELTDESVTELAGVADQLEEWAVQVTWDLPTQGVEQVFEELEPLLTVKQRVDQSRGEIWRLRHALLEIDEEDQRRQAVRLYLQVASQLIDLSSRLRYVLHDATDEQGHRRWVIVEIPERKSRIPATNLDEYLQRTLHYVFLRHSDAEAAASMGRTAANVIGNECQFDLTFRTERVAELRGKPLADVPIHAYCAGLLLICADATDRPRSEFFPITERPAGAQFFKNLERLGMSIGDGFVSPTGPLFSRQMEIVGEREPMYDPGREVKEAVYDHFADGMQFRKLQPTQDVYQQLRQRVVGLATTQPWIRRAVARAANVSERTDLESAARAAAVMETLDEIADAAVHDFEQSQTAIMLGTTADLEAQGLSAERKEEVLDMRREHGKLLNEWLAGQLTPRELRTNLVDYYRRRGQEQLDERFSPSRNNAEVHAPYFRLHQPPSSRSSPRML